MPSLQRDHDQLGSRRSPAVAVRRRVRPRTVVITGASSGIGLATALAFARSGDRLVLAARGETALERARDRCRRLGAAAIAVPTDVTDADAVQALARRAVEEGGTLDVWVSNVGVGAFGAYEATPMAAHEGVVRANLIGHMNEAHAAIPIFKDQGRGVFINVVSLGAFAPAPFAVAYSASKFGLRGFSEALRAELSDHPGIHLCDIHPGFVDTPGLSHSANYSGRRLTAPPPLVDAGRVAAAILDVADHPRPTRMVGWIAYAARAAHALAPHLTGRVGAWAIRSYLRHAARADVVDGNVFQATAGRMGVSGGLGRWSDEARAASIAASAVGAVWLLQRLLPRRS